MQLGFVSAIFGDLSLEEVFQHASDLGFDCVEVMCWPPGGPDRKYGGVCHLDCVDFSQSQADDSNALAEKYGVAISALG
ncbi:MAG: sugar phosphate isomerase/epimerase, partial [Lacipirellulaceae bacterium]